MGGTTSIGGLMEKNKQFDELLVGACPAGGNSNGRYHNTIFKEAGELVAILSQALITAKGRANGTSNLKCATSNVKDF